MLAHRPVFLHSVYLATVCVSFCAKPQEQQQWCCAISKLAVMQAIKNSSKPVTPPVGLKQNKTAGSPGAALAKSPQLPGMPSFQVRHLTRLQHHSV